MPVNAPEREQEGRHLPSSVQLHRHITDAWSFVPYANHQVTKHLAFPLHSIISFLFVPSQLNSDVLKHMLQHLQCVNTTLQRVAHDRYVSRCTV